MRAPDLLSPLHKTSESKTAKKSAGKKAALPEGIQQDHKADGKKESATEQEIDEVGEHTRKRESTAT